MFKEDSVVLVDGIPTREKDANSQKPKSIAAHFDFEDGNFGSLSAKRLVGPYSATVQSDVVRIGTHAARFELRPGDYISEGQRAELRDWLNAPLEADIWYGFSLYLDKNFPVTEGVGCVLAQWHDQAKLGDPSGKPPIAIRFKDGRLFITGAHSKTASHDPDNRFEFYSHNNFPLGQWTDFVFRVFWSQQGISQVEAWMNEKLMFTYTGKLGYENETTGPYFKFGMYCHGNFTTPHIAYHDNYSRGQSFEDVNPALSHWKHGL